VNHLLLAPERKSFYFDGSNINACVLQLYSSLIWLVFIVLLQELKEMLGIGAEKVAAE